MKVLLVQPGPSRLTRIVNIPARPEPLNLAILAASIPDHEVRIVDLRSRSRALGPMLTEFEPDVVGVTSLTTEVNEARKVLRDVRAFSPEILTVAGGIHASLVCKDFQLPAVDVIVVGEGELTFPDLLRHHAEGRSLAGVPGIRYRDRRSGAWHSTGPRAERVVLDQLALPRRDLTEAAGPRYPFFFCKDMASIETARGCPFGCRFCSVWAMHGRTYRAMSPERVLAELATVRQRDTLFVDDNFLHDVDRADRIADLVKAEGLRKTYAMQARSDTIARHPRLIKKWKALGLRGILVGFETPSSERLKRLNKANTVDLNERAIRIMHEYDVAIWAAFIVDPDFTEDDFKMLAEYVRKNRISIKQFTVLTPLPGTPLFDERYDDLITHDYRYFDCFHSVLPTRMEAEKFYRRFASLYRLVGIRKQISNILKGHHHIEDLLVGFRVMRSLANPQTYLRDYPK